MPAVMRLLLACVCLCACPPPVEAASSVPNSSSPSPEVQLVSTLGPVLSSARGVSLLKVGAPASFTSQDSAYFNQSSHMYNGWSLFVQWTNVGRRTEGGVSGIQIGNQSSLLLELAVVEDYSSSAVAGQAAALLVHNYSADFLFGPYSFPLTAATANVTDPANVLLLSASSLYNPQYGQCSTTTSTELLLALQPPPATFVHSLFKTLLWLGAQSVAIVVDDVNDSYCQNVTEMQALAQLYNVTLHGYYEVYGGAGSEAYSASMRSILSDLQDSSSPVDVVAGCPQRDLAGNPYQQSAGQSVCLELPLMAKNLSYSPAGLLFVNCDFEDPATAVALGSAASYLLALVPWHPSPLIRESASGWTAQDFHSRYTAQFKTRPTYHAAAAFASGHLLQTALEELPYPLTNNYNDGRQLVNILKENGTYYPSIFGNISFNACGESMMELLLLQGQEGGEGPRLQSAVVFPPQYAAPSASPNASSLLVYPAPSWPTRNCEEATQNCGGHGVCVEESGKALCQCDPGYYGLVDVLSCDTLCMGESRDGYCIESQTFYIGGTYGGNFDEHEEHIAHMRHAIALINNKTDGWFDEDMPQVQIVLQIEDSGCDADVADAALHSLQSWAVEESGGESVLTAVVGAFCSGASMAIATDANSQDFFQISYASTNEALSDVDQYRYFARTAASDAIQGPLLAKSLIALGATPFLAVMHLTDSYSSSLAKAVIQKYEESGEYLVLLTLPFDSEETSDADYHDLVFQVGESGAAVILFVGYQDIALKVFGAAALHPVLSSSQVLWVGVDAWTGLELQDTTLLPIGTIGITPQVAQTPVTEDYVRRWAALPPDEYPSLHQQGGGSRQVLATYSSTLVDATVALGIALQHAVDKRLDFNGASLFSEVTANVYFEGVSGQINFDAAGDLLYPTFSLSNYREPLDGGSNGEWVVVGNVTETSFYIDWSLVQWPGQKQNTSSFRQQLTPWCAAGSEPLLTFATGISSCSPCKVGFFKSKDGQNACQECPEGALCDDTGIAIPCIEYGYWRDPAAQLLDDDFGDFSKYGVYRCEVHDVCYGGCVLNNSCAPNRQKTSPVCAVCEVNMYMSDYQCYSCSAESMDNKHFRIFVYLLATLGLVIFLALILFVNLLVTPLPPLEKKDAEAIRERADEAVEDVFISEQLIHDMQGSKGIWGMNSSVHAISSVGGSGKGRLGGEEVEEEVEMTESHKQSESEVVQIENTVSADAKSSHSKKRYSSRMRFGAILLKNKNGFKKFIRGSSITGKITISFMQVLTGSFFTLNLQYPSYMRQFYVDLQLNPFQPIESTFKCADQENSDDDYNDNNTEKNVYFLSILFSVLCPIFFLVILLLAILISRAVYFKYFYPKRRPLAEYRKQFLNRQFSKIYNLSIKLYIWFCLIMYPVLSANIMGVFNCRDLGEHTGIFLRGDYAVSCESDTYHAARQVAIAGIVFIPLGVPLFFAGLIYHRHSPWLKQPSFFLHGNYLPRWRYFEVLDLLRKLTLTSIAPYIGEVDSTSQCLFLLVVDTASLVLLAFSKPYQNSRDDFLALTLATTECAAFLLGVVILSGIDQDDNYHTDALYACLFAWIVLDLVLVMPLSLAAKSTAFTRSMNAALTDTRTRLQAAAATVCNLPRLLFLRKETCSDLSPTRIASATNPLHQR